MELRGAKFICLSQNQFKNAKYLIFTVEKSKIKWYKICIEYEQSYSYYKHLYRV